MCSCPVPIRLNPCGGLRSKRGAWPTLRAFVKPSGFSLPVDPATPVVLVGPGTGIAPMRALLQEMEHRASTRGLAVGPAALYFGCKSPASDYLYQSELLGFRERGVLSSLHVAFSRSGARGAHGVDGARAGAGAAPRLAHREATKAP